MATQSLGGSRVLVFISCFFVLTSCGLPRIRDDAEEYTISGVRCTNSGCFPLPPECPSQSSDYETVSYALCSEWRRYGDVNQQALTKPRPTVTWIPKKDWWAALPWSKQKKQPTTWAPADDSATTQQGGQSRLVPDLCLAMSGGGLRSAAVNIGVLSGLSVLKPDNSQSVLDKVRIMSAVSGGSSALAWYFSQHWHQRGRLRGEVDKELFDDGGKYQHYLRDNYVTFYFPEYALGAFLNTLAIPVNFVANGIFG